MKDRQAVGIMAAILMAADVMNRDYEIIDHDVWMRGCVRTAADILEAVEEIIET